jgi:cytochrome b6-f complex iron-sulfur subunit
MASATPTKAKAVAAPTKDAAPVAPDLAGKGVTRREFLYYIWGASMALLTAQFGVAVIWFALPRFRAGEFGGVFLIDPASLLPAATDAVPVDNAAGKFWLSNTDEGFRALSKVCTHLGCLFKWVDTNKRFECPCHGSKFTNKGAFIEGPAPRGLDLFEVTIFYQDGSSKKSDGTGSPVPTTNASRIEVNTGKKIKGAAHA